MPRLGLLDCSHVKHSCMQELICLSFWIHSPDPTHPDNTTLVKEWVKMWKKISIALYFSCWILSLFTAIKGCLSEFGIFQTSTFKPTGSLSSTDDKMYKNYLNTRKHGRLDSTDCLDSLSLFNQNLTRSSGQQREVKGFLPVGPSRQLSHKCLKSKSCRKIKVPPPLLLQPPRAPPAGNPLSFWWCWKRAGGTSILERYLWITSPSSILHSFYSDSSHLFNSFTSKMIYALLSKKVNLI